MTEYQWGVIRADAVKRFGQFPHAETEADILEVFKLTPGLVVRAIDEVAAQIASGSNIRSAWAIVRKRVQDSGTSEDVTVTDTSERESAIRKARNWIRHAGIHYAEQHEVEDDLFGDRGQLRYWDTPPLRAEMLHLWEAQRPRGEKVEALAIEWDDVCLDAAKRIKAYRAKKRAKEGLLSS